MVTQQVSTSKRGCLARLKGVYRSLNPAEKKVSDYILAYPEEVIGLSITEVAENSKASEATVVRVSQLVGYQGFQELKIMLAKDLGSFFAEIPEEIKRGDSMSEVTAKVLQTNIQAIRDTLDVLDVGEMERTVKAISNARRVLKNLGKLEL
ncbi:unnamed protein product [marine sediment metagenome]|uniref:HTH rpiR-type domain-containing protein n=1 Tax=marine sediment metagenome TaxID=412755 RepID=X1R6A6_9ZZZZ